MGHFYSLKATCIAAATLELEVRCGACGHPKSGIIRTETGLCSYILHRQREHNFDAVSFRTIRTDINGPFLLSKCFIEAAIAHDYEIGCGAGGHPKSSHHQD